MADTLDVVTLAAAKAGINMPAATTAHDTELARQITAVSRIIDDVCGPVVQRTITGELHDGGRTFVTLRRRPVASITTVKEARGGTPETLTAQSYGSSTGGYFAPTYDKDPALLAGDIERRNGGLAYRWWPGRDVVQVTYVAGRYANTAAVDARFAEAACAVLRRLWKRESGSWAIAASIFETADAEPTAGFFRAVKPIVEELLFDEVQTHLVGFA